MKRAVVRIPNAKPRAFGNIFAVSKSVRGIVILNRKTASVPQTGLSGKRKRKRNAQESSVTKDVRPVPNLSARKPPQVFPRTTPATTAKAQRPVFHEKENVIPAYERRMTTRTTRIKAAKGIPMLTFFVLTFFVLTVFVPAQTGLISTGPFPEDVPGGLR